MEGPLDNNEIRFVGIEKKTSTFHDFPYDCPQRKCLHAWVINTGPPGRVHCVHDCVYCYARYAFFSRPSEHLQYYTNLPELVEKDLRRIDLCPPVSLSNATDPCQEVPPLRAETARLVRLLVSKRISFYITTRGDARFLLDIPGFAEFPRKAVSITIEGTEEMVRLLSPRAPSFHQRISFVQALSGKGVWMSIRLDPFLVHLARAIHGAQWGRELENLMKLFSQAGARHIISSTGRLSKNRGKSGEESIWNRLRQIIEVQDSAQAEAFSGSYHFSRDYTSSGYLLEKRQRLDFHRRARELAEANGMTYATCQETHAEETDSPGLPNCEGIALPFARKGTDGAFRAIEGCTANCHVKCKGSPPCGIAELITTSPLKKSLLKDHSTYNTRLFK